MGSVSSDGKHQAILSYQDRTPQIVLVDPAGKNLQRVTDTPEDKQRAEFSPVGKAILYDVISRNGGHISGQIYKINIDGTGNVHLADRMNQE